MFSQEMKRLHRVKIVCTSLIQTQDS